MDRIKEIEAELARLGDERVVAYTAILQAKEAVRAAEEAHKEIRAQRLTLQAAREQLIVTAAKAGEGWRCWCGLLAMPVMPCECGKFTQLEAFAKPVRVRT